MVDVNVRRIAFISLLGLGLAWACKPPPAVAPPVAAPEPPPPPPPPPKTCDTLDDACVATAETRSPIQKSGWSLAPPPEWTYAHEESAFVAKTEAASIGAVVHETGNKKTVAAKRSEAFDAVTQKLGLTAPKKKVAWPPRAMKVVPVHDVKVALYQFGGFTRDDKPGVVLVFTSKLSDADSLLGVGFVLESDTRDADKAILTCVESLRSDGSPADAHDGGAPEGGAAK